MWGKRGFSMLRAIQLMQTARKIYVMPNKKLGSKKPKEK